MADNSTRHIVFDRLEVWLTPSLDDNRTTCARAASCHGAAVYGRTSPGPLPPLHDPRRRRRPPPPAGPCSRSMPRAQRSRTYQGRQRCLAVSPGRAAFCTGTTRSAAGICP